jgi:hypothetical protein
VQAAVLVRLADPEIPVLHSYTVNPSLLIAIAVAGAAVGFILAEAVGAIREVAPEKASRVWILVAGSYLALDALSQRLLYAWILAYSATLGVCAEAIRTSCEFAPGPAAVGVRLALANAPVGALTLAHGRTLVITFPAAVRVGTEAGLTVLPIGPHRTKIRIQFAAADTSVQAVQLAGFAGK